MFPAGQSRGIPKNPAHGLPGHLQIQFKDQDMVKQAVKDQKTEALISYVSNERNFNN
jgi:hypothetical protein